MFSINKKFYLEVGFENKTNQWTDYPILWFPQGVFIINGASASHSASGTTLNLSFKDKMCLLSGDCGGTLSDTIEFHKYDTQDGEGNWVSSYPTLYQIILECVNHLGHEDMSRIYIADIDTRVKQVMKWTGSQPLYITYPDDPQHDSEVTLTEPTSGVYREYDYGRDVGFVYTDFIWNNGELVSKPGDTVVTILDKIKNLLGNYEYFYDIWGNFHFQEKRNYLNISQSTVEETVDDETRILIDFDNLQYNVFDLSRGKAEYDFSQSPLILSYSNSPAYNKVKNDYVAWGQRTGVNGGKIPIRYHLAIDKKPTVGNSYHIILKQDENSNVTYAKIIQDDYVRVEDFPIPGNPAYYYSAHIGQDYFVYYWDTEQEQYVLVDSLPLGYNKAEYLQGDGQAALSMWTRSPGLGSGSATLKMKFSIDQPGDFFGYWQNRQYENTYAWFLAVTKNSQTTTSAYSTYAALTNAISSDYASNRGITVTYPYKGSPYCIYVNENNNLCLAIGDVIQEFTDLEWTPNTIFSLEIKENGDSAQVFINDKDYSSLFTNTKLASFHSHYIVNESPYLFQIGDSTAGSLSNGAGGKLYSCSINGYEFIPVENENLSNVSGLYVPDLHSFRYVTGAINAHTNVGGEITYNPSKTFVTTDWRTELYMQALKEEPFGLKTNYYSEEMITEWPKIYDFRNEKIYDKYLGHPEDLDYWIDFIDGSAEITKISIGNIGKRTEVKQNDKINCIFEPLVPDLVLIETNQLDTEDRRTECQARGQKFVQIEPSIFEHFTKEVYLNSAYYEVQDMLYQGSSYNEAVNLSIIPIYYLEPNTLITAFDKDSDVHGDYLLRSISIPLGISGTSNISAQRALNKF